ncbi:DUF3696 domain-containing protein [Methanococcus maripaludis]|uniref:DUF3696 domain-containing protein n=1 Tax=Methanococcus maripaludis TaxID=39152 RepID=A0A8T3W4E1_METMI|nr:DUF3696 domain-containing protein [Methanococcus maripaludis]MBG0768339.1 DUF3696 domain-containing protein [Methanococcus maripaludis]
MDTIRLKNIKAFEDTGTIELKPITIFVGKNSSGKSSLIRFFPVLAQTFQDDTDVPLSFFGRLIDYGNFEEVVHHSGNTIEFEIPIKYRMNRSYYNIFEYGWAPYFKSEDPEIRKIIREMEFALRKSPLVLNIKLIKHNKKLTVSNLKIFNDEITFVEIKRSTRNQYKIFLKLNDYGFDHSLKTRLDFYRFIPIIIPFNNQLKKKILDSVFNPKNINEMNKKTIAGYFKDKKPLREFSDDHKKIISDIKYSFTLLTLIENLFTIIRRDLEDFSNNMQYIGPFRNNPERVYRDPESNFSEVGTAGENTIMLLRRSQQNRSNTLKNVSNWLYDTMGLKIKIEDIGQNSNLFKVLIYAENADPGDNIKDVGYGISQVLPIVTQLYTLPKIRPHSEHNSKMYIIEQPELHLHPAAQSSLADLFVNKAVSDRRSKFLIETHSEHLIRKLQVLIADPDVKISANDVAIYYIDKNSSDPLCKMDLTEYGQFTKKWPTGFFDESYNLSKKLLKARAKGDIK